jgi:hypothetical protein
LKDGYKIPVKMTPEEASTINRERNNKSDRDKMAFVRTEVKRLVASGQIIQVDSAPECTNLISVALKINSDGSIRKRFVINLSHGRATEEGRRTGFPLPRYGCQLRASVLEHSSIWHNLKCILYRY